MSDENQFRASFFSRPLFLGGLVTTAALAFTVSVLLTFSPVGRTISPTRSHALQIVNVSVSSAALLAAMMAAASLFRRRPEINSDELITVCAWTRRVQWHGRWLSFEEYLTERFHLRCTHGICDEAAQKLRNDLRKASARSAQRSA